MKHRYSFFEKIQLTLTLLMQASLAVALVIAFVNEQWPEVFVSILALFVILLPSLLARGYQFHFPLPFEFTMTLFIYASLFLGVTQGYYTRFWWWDSVLHAGSGIALGFVGFLILYSLYRDSRLDMSPFLLAMFSFAFSLAIAVVWEIFEFAMDKWFGLDMQIGGLRDTMWDLIVATGGALVASVSGFLFVKYRTRGIGVFRYYLKSYFNNNRKK